MKLIIFVRNRSGAPETIRHTNKIHVDFVLEVSTPSSATKSFISGIREIEMLPELVSSHVANRRLDAGNEN